MIIENKNSPKRLYNNTFSIWRAFSFSIDENLEIII